MVESMQSVERETELAELLNRHEVLRLRGYTFALGPQGGVIVGRWGHVRGVWRACNDGYGWIPASNTEPVHWSENAEAAVRFTLVMMTSV